MNGWPVRADARQIPLRDESVDCVVTSPPYWGLRDYGVDGQIGLEESPSAYVEQIVKAMMEARRVLRPRGVAWLVLGDSHHNGDKRGYQPSRVKAEDSMQSGNLASDSRGAPHRLPQEGLKAKDLVGIPWRVAFALQAAGWWLRSDVVWAKPNPMPESVTDRPTRSHEYVFLLAKSERYWYDANAIREPHVYGDHHRNGVLDRPPEQAPGQRIQAGFDRLRRFGTPETWRGSIPENHTVRGFDTRPSIPGQRERRSKTAGPGPHAGGRRQAPEPGEPGAFHPNGRNARSVWTIPTQPYRGAHFATFPEELARRCIRAGCPAGGTVLDPFAGSGTVGKVAIEEGRYAVLCDLAYQSLAAARIANTQRPLMVPA